MAARYIVPALAVAGRAAAQSSCSNAATTTIQSGGDASALAACSTFSGSIALATGVTDNIAINGVQHITGDLVASNVTQITELSGDSLTTIGGSFTLSELTILSTLNFPRLTSVETVQWEALPALQGLSFTTGMQMANTVNIDNTQLNTLDGINLQTVDTMTISNNPYLEEVTMQLGNVSTSLLIYANGRNMSTTFPNLEWAGDLVIRNASLVSIPSLSSVNGSLGFYSGSFTSLAAPNLTSVGSSLSIVANSALTNISFPELATVGGGLLVANNSDLEAISFPSVKTVSGALQFNGAFTDVELAALGDVKGAFDLQSTGDITSACSHFQPLSGQNNVIKGTYTCSGKEASVSGVASGTSSGSSASSTAKSSSANTVYISGASGLMGVVAAIFGML